MIFVFVLYYLVIGLASTCFFGFLPGKKHSQFNITLVAIGLCVRVSANSENQNYRMNK